MVLRQFLQVGLHMLLAPLPTIHSSESLLIRVGALDRDLLSNPSNLVLSLLYRVLFKRIEGPSCRLCRVFIKTNLNQSVFEAFSHQEH